jgi:uncharacterized phosphosugar-binding protein
VSIDQTSGLAYLKAIRDVLEKIEATQMPALSAAAEICANSIAAGGLVHLFGTGHSRIPVEEIFPRHGSFPGFHPIVELSLTFHNQVVGANGQRQAMYLEKLEGFGEVILRNFIFGPHDSFMAFSNGGERNDRCRVRREAARYARDRSCLAGALSGVRAPA